METKIRNLVDDITYWFEGEPKITEFENAVGEKMKEYIYQYGGWELDFTKK